MQILSCFLELTAIEKMNGVIIVLLKIIDFDPFKGVWAESSRLIPLFSSVLIPYSAIAKTILVRSLIFHSLTRVENQPLKNVKTNTTHYF